MFDWDSIYDFIGSKTIETGETPATSQTKPRGRQKTNSKEARDSPAESKPYFHDKIRKINID